MADDKFKAWVSGRQPVFDAHAKQANALSDKAKKSGTAEDHKAAAKAHERVSDMGQRLQGVPGKEIAKHEAAAREHNSAAIAAKGSARDQKMEQIAQKHLGVETLKTRGHDGLDFHETTPWTSKAAIDAAYRSGHMDVAKHSPMEAPAKTAGAIAKEHFGHESLTATRSGKDFKETSVASMKDGLTAAYNAGRSDAKALQTKAAVKPTASEAIMASAKTVAKGPSNQINLKAVTVSPKGAGGDDHPRDEHGRFAPK